MLIFILFFIAPPPLSLRASMSGDLLTLIGIYWPRPNGPPVLLSIPIPSFKHNRKIQRFVGKIRKLRVNNLY